MISSVIDIYLQRRPANYKVSFKSHLTIGCHLNWAFLLTCNKRIHLIGYIQYIFFPFTSSLSDILWLFTAPYCYKEKTSLSSKMIQNKSLGDCQREKRYFLNQFPMKSLELDLSWGITEWIIRCLRKFILNFEATLQIEISAF